MYIVVAADYVQVNMGVLWTKVNYLLIWGLKENITMQ